MANKSIMESCEEYIAIGMFGKNLPYIEGGDGWRNYGNGWTKPIRCPKFDDDGNFLLDDDGNKIFETYDEAWDSHFFMPM